MPNIYGCDSAKKGLAFVSLPNVSIWIPCPKTRNFLNILEFYFLECNKIFCDALFIEDVLFVRNYKATLELAQVFGVVGF